MGMETKEHLKAEDMETRKDDVKEGQIQKKLKIRTEMSEETIPVTWRGKSLVATRKVEVGKVLLLEAAVLELNPEEAKLEREVERLDKEELHSLDLLQKRFHLKSHKNLHSTRLAKLGSRLGCKRTIEEIFFSRAVNVTNCLNPQKLSQSYLLGSREGRMVETFPNNRFSSPFLLSQCCLAGGKKKTTSGRNLFVI